MDQVIGVLGTIIVFGLIIFVHELGHFIVAKLSGMTVYDFALGFGPALIQRKVGDTVYAIRMVPLGGFVRIAGMELEDFEEEEVDGVKQPKTPDPNGFNEKPIYLRFATILAGVTMNVILALIVLIVIGLSVGYPKENGPAIIADLTKPSPAAAAGLLPGDIIVGINGHTDVRVDNASKYIGESKGVVNLTYTRNGEVHTASITETTLKRPVINGIFLKVEEFQGIGVSMTSTLASVNPIEAVKQGGLNLVDRFQFGLANITYIFSGQAKLRDLGGPVTIMHLSYDASRTAWHTSEGIANFLGMLATINVLIAVFNVLPIPALDGGHLFFLVVEAIYRKPLDRKKLAWIHAVGLVILLSLIALITVNDIIRWVHPPK